MKWLLGSQRCHQDVSYLESLQLHFHLMLRGFKGSLFTCKLKFLGLGLGLRVAAQGLRVTCCGLRLSGYGLGLRLRLGLGLLEDCEAKVRILAYLILQVFLQIQNFILEVYLEENQKVLENFRIRERVAIDCLDDSYLADGCVFSWNTIEVVQYLFIFDLCSHVRSRLPLLN